MEKTKCNECGATGYDIVGGICHSCCGGIMEPLNN